MESALYIIYILTQTNKSAALKPVRQNSLHHLQQHLINLETEP